MHLPKTCESISKTCPNQHFQLQLLQTRTTSLCLATRHILLTPVDLDLAPTPVHVLALVLTAPNASNEVDQRLERPRNVEEDDRTHTADHDLALAGRTPDPYPHVARASAGRRTHPLAHLGQGDAGTHEADPDPTARTVDRLLLRQRPKLRPLAARLLEDAVYPAEAVHTVATARL